MTAGKMLGGTSGLSYMVYARGAQADFDRWEKMGNENWSWNDVLPYFKLSERLDDLEINKSNTSCLHGTDGPMNVRKPEWKDRSYGYLDGFRQNGRNIQLDTNSFENMGYSMSQLNIDDHYRQSTAISYLKLAKDRKNLKLLLNCEVTKIVINENKEATGVEVILNSGKKVTLCASKEVILCAGTFNSPKVLMLSGIGPREHLEENGIKVVKDSPKVGENLGDAPFTFVSFTGRQGFLKSFRDNFDLFANLNSFPNPVIIGNVATNKSQKFADYRANVLPLPPASIISSVFCSSVFGLTDEICISLVKGGLLKETLFAVVSLFHPESKGTLRMRMNCSDPKAPPVITTGYYSNPKDLERHAQYMLDYISVLDTKYFRSFESRIIELDLKQCKYLQFKSLEYWKCYILNTATSMWNFFGTCTMGPQGVVDASLKVYGVKRLRVVDASVMPASISGNTQAAVVMIAEKASDMIKKDDCQNIYG